MTELMSLLMMRRKRGRAGARLLCLPQGHVPIEHKTPPSPRPPHGIVTLEPLQSIVLGKLKCLLKAQQESWGGAGWGKGKDKVESCSLLFCGILPLLLVAAFMYAKLSEFL